MCKILCGHVFNSLKFIPKSEIAGSYGILHLTFEGLQNCFQSGCTTLYSHQQYVRVSVSLHPQHYMLLVFFIIPILESVGMTWYVMVLVCISLLANNIEHLFICLLCIYVSSLEKCLFKFFAHF